MQAQVKIEGKVSSFDGSKGIGLFIVQEGALVLHEFIEFDSDSTFSFTIKDASTGFYSLGSSANVKSVFDEFYLQAGQKAKLSIRDKKIVPASLPNQDALAYQEQWTLTRKEVLDGAWQKTREVEHVEGLVKAYYDALQTYVNGLNTKDGTLKHLMQLRAQLDFDMYWMRTFTMVPTEVHQVLKQNKYLQEIIDRKHTSADILKVKEGAMASSMYPGFIAYWNKADVDDYLKFSIDTYDNDTLKGRYLTSHIIGQRISGKYFDKLMTQYGSLIVTDVQRQQLKVYQAEVMKFAHGADAFDFTYPDAEGKMHALSDYKGKLVLVDVWATWCAPCKAQIPHLELLMNTYKGNDEIVFISVSIDKKKDREKWLSFIIEKHLGGIQLLADYAFESDIIYNYEISGVPRFMLFDKEGKILSVNAPRPSDPQLKELIDEYL